MGGTDSLHRFGYCCIKTEGFLDEHDIVINSFRDAHTGDFQTSFFNLI